MTVQVSPTVRGSSSTDGGSRPGRAARAGADAVHRDRPRPARRRAVLLGYALCAAGLVMIPWLVVLAVTLPPATAVSHWPATWVGLDGMEALTLFATGALLRRRDDRARLSAVAAAALILADAWFDVLTATSGADRISAIVLAVCVELPMTALLLNLALRTRARAA